MDRSRVASIGPGWLASLCALGLGRRAGLRRGPGDRVIRYDLTDRDRRGFALRSSSALFGNRNDDSGPDDHVICQYRKNSERS